MLVLMVVLAASALVPGVLAQDDENATASNVTPAEPADEADATNVTPGADGDSELPTERESTGNTPGAGVSQEPNDVQDSERFQGDAPQESVADSAWFTVLALLATVALGVLALLGVAYAAYRRGGDQR